MPSFIPPSPPPPSTRPKVLVLGTPNYVGDQYLAEFQKSYDVTVTLPPCPPSVPFLHPPIPS